MADKPSVLRETDDDARGLARTLLRGARYGALAVIDPVTGFPSASRVALATAPDGTPAILVSSLSAHTQALEADPRCSLLTGEPGKGDPLAHPRLSLQALAETVARESPLHAHLRRRFLSRHPKAALYIDFGDFRFVLLKPVSASLNGGFGKAYVLPGTDLCLHHPDLKQFTEQEPELLSTISTEMPDIASQIAKIIFRQNGDAWKIVALDAGGIDILSGDILLRLEIPFQYANKVRIFSDIRKVACSIP